MSTRGNARRQAVLDGRRRPPRNSQRACPGGRPFRGASTERIIERRRPLIAALICEALFAAAFTANASFAVGGVRYFTLFDDAMVSMRYARNLAHGAGLVWNAGEPPVEGYSNLLWTLWMAALHLVADERVVPLLVTVTGIAILLLNLGVVWALARVVAPERPRVWSIAVITVALSYSLMYWTLRGLEVGAVALCIDAALLAALAPSGRWRLPLLACALAALPPLRADGMVPALFIAACWSLTDGRYSLGRRLTILAIPIVSFAAQEWFRFHTYGAWLPNTYYLKMAGVPLLDRLRRGTLQLGLTSLWALWPVLGFSLIAGPLERGRRMLAGVAAVMCAYSVYVGADAWEWTGLVNRYITSGLPPAIVLAACGIDRFADTIAARRGRALAALLLAGVAVQAAVAFWFFPERELAVLRIPLVLALAVCAAACIFTSSSRVAVWTAAIVTAATLSAPKFLEWGRFGDLHVIDDAFMSELGLRLRDVSSPDARLGVVWAGAVPYFSQRPCVDLLGKNDVYVAHLPSRRPFIPGHSKWDYRHSISTGRPDLVLGLWKPTAEDVAYLRTSGYEAGASAWVLRDSQRVDAAKVFALVAEIDARRASASARPH